MSKRIDVSKHTRKVREGRTTVKRHQRKIKDFGDTNLGRYGNFQRRNVKFESTYSDLGEVEQAYYNSDDNYRLGTPFDSMQPKLSDFMMTLSRSDGSREHHRIYDMGEVFLIESHIDHYDSNPNGKFSPTGAYNHITEEYIKKGKWNSDSQVVIIPKSRGTKNAKD